MPIGAVLISDSLSSARHQPKWQDHGHRASVSPSVPVYLPAFTHTNIYCLVTEAHGDEQLA